MFRPYRLRNSLIKSRLPVGRVLSADRGKKTGKLFWDLTGSPAGNYISEASGGNWPNVRVSETNL